MQLTHLARRSTTGALLALALTALRGSPSALPPVDPTPIDALPFTIDTPGEYRLTQDLQASPGDAGIRVTCPGVTVDLGGFTVSGGDDGAAVSASASRVTVRNGRVVQWGAAGVSLLADSRVYDVTVDVVALEGIRTGSNSVVERCIVRNAGETGIEAVNGARVSDCVVDWSGLEGIYLNQGIVRDCHVRGDDQGSADHPGIHVFGAGRVEGCTVYGVPGDGVRVGARGIVRDTTVADVARRGIASDADARVDGCSVAGAGLAGIQLGSGLVSGSRVANAAASDAAQAAIELVSGGRIESCEVVGAAGDGLRAGPAGLVRDCRVASAAGHAIYVSPGGSAADCTVLDAGLTGVYLESGSAARGCVVQGGTGFGLNGLEFVRVSDCVVDGAGLIGAQVLRGSIIERTTVARSSFEGISLANPFASAVDCRAVANGADGLHVQSSAVVRGCTSAGNGGTGIYAAAAGALLEGNYAGGNGRGIELDGTDSLSVRNAAFGNGTDFVQSLSNVVGPVLKTQSFVTNANPWLNFDLDSFQ